MVLSHSLDFTAPREAVRVPGVFHGPCGQSKRNWSEDRAHCAGLEHGKLSKFLTLKFIHHYLLQIYHG